jgi:Cytochrome c554 and c-prime
MRRIHSRPLIRRLLAGALAVIAFVVAWITLFRQSPNPPQLTAAPEVPKVEPQVLFKDWPKGGQPDLVIVLTGQMHGYLQKCGCSNPQKGGLERRYNFIESLKARGWEVVGLDIGDVPRPLPYTPTKEQTLLKYEVAMQAMKIMGYKGVAVGREELSMPLLDALTKFSVQKGNEFPKVHAANISNRENFPGPGGDGKPAIAEMDILTAKTGVTVGVVSVLGAEVTQKQIDRNVKFAPDAGGAVTGILKAWKAAGTTPNVKVLLYQGPFNWTNPATGKKTDAQTAAEAFEVLQKGQPDFQVVLCKTPDDSDAPNMPTVVNDGKTMICQVGQKGQSVGVLGIYKAEKGGIELYYQRVVMTEEFETPPAKEKGHALLKLLQDYSDTVRDNDYLSEMAKKKKPHAIQTLPKHQDAAYAGDKQCFACHQAEDAVWQKSKHAQAYDALAKIAKHPAGRNFDGECIICHTVGYDIKTGYVNEPKTAHLKNVQCESCHGPSSLHVTEETANAKKKSPTHEFAASLSPWKTNGKGAMPALDKLETMLKEKDHGKREAMLDAVETKVYLSVYQTCAKCHDIDNDPHFDLAAYWQNVAHSGMKKKK